MAGLQLLVPAILLVMGVVIVYRILATYQLVRETHREVQLLRDEMRSLVAEQRRELHH